MAEKAFVRIVLLPLACLCSIDEKSPLHALTRKKAKKKRKVARMPDNNRNVGALIR
jgi:hypothetical protein